MTEATADIKEAARVALSSALRDPRVGFAIKATMIGGGYEAFTGAIEAAIMEERERCARIADERQEEWTRSAKIELAKGRRLLGSPQITAEIIALKIRYPS